MVWERGYVGDVGGEYNGVSTGQDLRESRDAATLIADAVKAAEGADYVIFIGGLNKADRQDSEGLDRVQYGLPYGQDAVIEALAAATDKLVVVNISGNAVAMPWVEKVPAIVQDWYLGTQAGHSLADVLSGDVNPRPPAVHHPRLLCRQPRPDGEAVSRHSPGRHFRGPADHGHGIHRGHLRGLPLV